MDGLLSVVRKEFRHIFRDRVSLLLLFLMPAVILLLFGYALSFEVRQIDIKVLDEVRNAESAQLIAHLEAHPKLHVTGSVEGRSAIDETFWEDVTRAVLAIGKDGVDIFLDGSSATLSIYAEDLLQQVIGSHFAERRGEALPFRPLGVRHLYNPTLKREYMPIPGLVLMIFILVSSIVLGTSINKEKVRGTFRLLRLSSLSDGQIILGNSFPYMLI